ncbi:MAG: hypothetical protein JXB88_25475 [Spirochaetales bacterium]|nr:hypothetical protein [Spirochaetales bacterium]
MIEPDFTGITIPDNDNVLELHEEKTHYYFTPGQSGPIINHANFMLMNNSGQDVYFYIKKADFISRRYPAGSPLSLIMTWMYLNKKEHGKITDQFHIGQGDHIKFSLFFKGFDYTQSYYEDIYVLLTLNCQGKEYPIKSPIYIIKKNRRE